jgi:hypothetical protein
MKEVTNNYEIVVGKHQGKLLPERPTWQDIITIYLTEILRGRNLTVWGVL